MKLLNITYKILAYIICKKLKLYFTTPMNVVLYRLRQIFGKTQETQIPTNCFIIKTLKSMPNTIQDAWSFVKSTCV